MKIIFFSDVHGNKYALDAFFKDIAQIQVDKIIFCGDIFGYYYYQEEIINILKEKKITCILGNHDKYFLDIIEKK